MRIVFILWLALLFPATSQSLTNLDFLKDSIAVYYEKGAYNLELSSIVDSVITKLESITISERDAAVFDVDETTLSNYSHIKAVGFGYIPSLWHEWVLEGKAETIVPIYILYKKLVDKGCKIIFITGRNDSQYEATFTNLITAGYTTFDTLITKPLGHKFNNAKEYKSFTRGELTSAGYNIVLCTGDQYSDLDGEFTGLRVKLPNYLYFVE